MAKKSARKRNSETAVTSSSAPKGGIPESITILVHGTFSRAIGFWYRPRSKMARYLRANVFEDVYGRSDYFRWTATADDAAREQGKDDLLKWCEEHPASKYNFVAHSHGCSVVSFASNEGLNNIGKLVLLAPPVWRDRPEYHPNLSNVDDGKVFNFHARQDLIVTQVARPPAVQNY
ncbi:MAG: alpha/beta hydrolase, partial [Planctomycetota bacterium]